MAALCRYLRATGARAIERVRIPLPQRKNELIANETMWGGRSTNPRSTSARSYPRRPPGRHRDHLVHNHPSATPPPRRIIHPPDPRHHWGRRHMKVTLHDHVIIGAKPYRSLEGLSSRTRARSRHFRHLLNLRNLRQTAAACRRTRKHPHPARWSFRRQLSCSWEAEFRLAREAALALAMPKTDPLSELRSDRPDLPTAPTLPEGRIPAVSRLPPPSPSPVRER